jgi:hypothetical protein
MEEDRTMELARDRIDDLDQIISDYRAARVTYLRADADASTPEQVEGVVDALVSSAVAVAAAAERLYRDLVIVE